VIRYAVPEGPFVQERDVLDCWSRNRGPELVGYRYARNATSLDGLPG
jgi:hypothetical protein